MILAVKLIHRSFKKILVAGAFLMLLFCPIAGIVGLAAPPDLSIKMLDHPEREHLRYLFLFLAAIIFGVFIFLLLRNNSIVIKSPTKWIITIVFFIAFVEFIWEFTHHYFYPEALKEWISEGKKAEDFGKNYDNINIINIGVIGRLLQFSSIIWLSIHLYKLRLIKIWHPIISSILGLLGIVSAIVIMITHFNIPKSFEILLIFFIPGFSFFLLYWLAVAILTKCKKNEIITWQNRTQQKNG
ncbi:MAG: hypothetical protein WBA94_11475 [Ferruginibacter sp.]